MQVSESISRSLMLQRYGKEISHWVKKNYSQLHYRGKFQHNYCKKMLVYNGKDDGGVVTIFEGISQGLLVWNIFFPTLSVIGSCTHS